MANEGKQEVTVEQFNELEQQLHSAKQELELSKQNELLALRIAVGYLLQERNSNVVHTH